MARRPAAGGRGSGGRKRGGARKRSGGKSRSGGKAPALLSRRAFLAGGLAAGGTLALSGGVGHYAALRLNEVARFEPGRLAALREGATTHLFETFPETATLVPWRPLGRHDTPVEELPALDGAGDVRIFLKRDDATSPLYGGNKVRKLEHILAEAELLGRRTLVTVGGSGTNHGLATALHGRRLGFTVQLALFPQPDTPHVRENAAAFAAAGAVVHASRFEAGAFYRAARLHREAALAGEQPYFIMVGGSSRLGAAGYVNAALELAAQVRSGVLPEPDRIFIALGSCGSAAGLLAGLRLAGLRSRVSAVRVANPLLANGAAVRYMAGDLMRWLRTAGPGVPKVAVEHGQLEVVTNQLGRGYGHATAAGQDAESWLRGRVRLEPAYTAKAAAACLEYCRRRARPGETVLYWHTANSAALPISPA